MCEKLLKCCFFPSASSSLCKYEYGKKCQDVFGEAVDIREVMDYFLEVCCLMIACVCVLHMPGTRQVDLMCFCVAEIIGLMQIPHINIAAGVTALFQQLARFVSPLMFSVGLLC